MIPLYKYNLPYTCYELGVMHAGEREEEKY